MFQNNHIWDIWLKTNVSEIPEGQELPVISGSSISGEIRSFLEYFHEWQTFSKGIFGEMGVIGSISFSDLNLDPDTPHDKIRSQLRLLPNGNLNSKNIIEEPSF